MSQILFRVVSIELKDSTISALNPQNIFRLNLTQRPRHIRQDFLVNDENSLRNINHEWNIDNSKNQVERVTLTLRSIDRKKVTGNSDQNMNNNAADDNEDKESKHTLIGYCTVDLKQLQKGADFDFTVQLLTRGNVKTVGYVHLHIISWENDQKLLKKEKKQKKKIVSQGKGYKNHKEYSSLI
ncbi:hypothetical protein M9Y10_021911 [Tritrichomonas musculus]|uniref:C2 NT-type domain-containing protein n=1 Tax=Tritrichomonas musculus TaxID=1915356 RepID=A0ABR2KQU7_9EUKA